MSTLYAQYPTFGYPTTLSEWSPISPIIPVNPIITVPVLVNPVLPQIYTPLVVPVLPSPVYSSESYYETPEESFEDKDPLEHYLTLPKDLFPSARMLALDPNLLIDEFCKIPDICKHASWILDLEFGVPKAPITRPIPTYNVKFNSIHCKNTPDAIHPGFESCNEEFKTMLLFYYDCIISAWYRGFMVYNNDRSVENFQTWLLLPLQVLGMCWS